MRTVEEKPDVRVKQEVVPCAEGVALDSLGLHPSLEQRFPNDFFHPIWIFEVLLGSFDNPF